jgi:NAD(P)-dependent dehydrogenase (short-subunit alcohol dehydrogenase family)
MERLAGKRAVITGAGSGIARAAARIFVAEGAQVVIAEIDEEKGQASAAEAGDAALYIHTDVTDEASVKTTMAEAKERLGGIDILFNCAGGSLLDDNSVTEVDMSVWDYTIPLDLKGPFLCCRHGVPKLIESGGGSIINVSSVVALRGNHPAHVYSAAKGGIISLTRSLAGVYSEHGVRANAICPGLIKTQRVLDRYIERERPNSRVGSVGTFESYPFGVGEPEDIANIALFLASDESRMVNAAVIPAEGGISAY